ncbi:MAG: endonuclease/exonuclease/phosphatase family protein [Rhodobacterales bacterium]|nr:endonuclease/exonuclease/phosphatase family protein [Rhodobacterales bacterium]
MRIATYNVEWFDTLFDDAGHLINDNTWSGRRDITRADQTEAIGRVFKAVDADAWMIIEAPDQSRQRNAAHALESFACRFHLRATKALIGFPTDTQQEIALLYDPDLMTVRHDPVGVRIQKRHDGRSPRFDGTFRLDPDVEGPPDHVTWSKPPLEVAVSPVAGKSFRLIGVHAKSKAPHGARSEAEIVRLSIENRRKQLAQCIWLRARVDEHLAAGEPLIVLGDFNDGPGLDEYEKLFNRSGIEIVLGEDRAIRLHDPHAHQVLSRRVVAAPSTARFRLPPDGRYLSALLDYIMVSPDIAGTKPRWHIWHPFDDPACYEKPVLRHALLTASDHFPVTLDFDFF